MSLWCYYISRASVALCNCAYMSRNVFHPWVDVSGFYSACRLCLYIAAIYRHDSILNKFEQLWLTTIWFFLSHPWFNIHLILTKKSCSDFLSKSKEIKKLSGHSKIADSKSALHCLLAANAENKNNENWAWHLWRSTPLPPAINSFWKFISKCK